MFALGRADVRGKLEVVALEWLETRQEAREQASGVVEEKVAVLIAGRCGTGKSHLAQAIGHCAARIGHDVLFNTQSQLIASLREVRLSILFDGQFSS